MSSSSAYKKKLIEVALPLDDINAASAREKSIRHGHPSTLHLWWARRPLATARAVIWASLVDDPSSHPEEFPTEEEQQAEASGSLTSCESSLFGRTRTIRVCSMPPKQRFIAPWAMMCLRCSTHLRVEGLFRSRPSVWDSKHMPRT